MKGDCMIENTYNNIKFELFTKDTSSATKN